jgi:hypothetical protein
LLTAVAIYIYALYIPGKREVDCFDHYYRRLAVGF